ncbi:MAG: PLDc N-terminal domain-containing protein [Candidatus Omnitrophica bacterium]|nr:PLDc N-terminal domain-containing protein [Candidatus Omnitrophota bacterium]
MMRPVIVVTGIMGLIAFFLILFWFLMLIDCCRRKFDKGVERLIWLAIILFANILGVTLYYFLIKRYNPQGLIDKDGHLR